MYPHTQQPYIPATPKFGGVRMVGTGQFNAWTGGKPTANFSGLENPNPISINPNQFIPTSVGSQAKSRAYRIQGLEPKIEMKTNLQVLITKVEKHFEDYGLDTGTYLPDPSDPTKVISGIVNYAMFNHKDGTKKANEIYANEFDEYERGRDNDRKDFFMNSLGEELETSIITGCRKTDCFMAIWFQFIHLVSSVSIERFEKRKTQLKERSLDNYPGENINSLADAYVMDWKYLDAGNEYDHNLTLTMLKECMKGGGKNEDYRHPLRKIKDKLDEHLLKIRHMSYKDKNTHMTTEELDVTSVMNACKKGYRDLLDNDEWPAAAHPKDRRGLKHGYGQTIASAIAKEAKVQVNALIQNATGDSKDSKFSKRNKGPGKFGAKSNSNNKNGGGRKSNGSPKDKKNLASKTPPPKRGESEIKIIDGVKRYWCKKCDRWTLSHGTNGHKTKEELEAERAAQA